MKLHLKNTRSEVEGCWFLQSSTMVLWMKKKKKAHATLQRFPSFQLSSYNFSFLPQICRHYKTQQLGEDTITPEQQWHITSLMTALLRSVQTTEKHPEYKIRRKLQLGKSTKHNITLNKSEENIHNSKQHTLAQVLKLKVRRFQSPGRSKVVSPQMCSALYIFCKNQKLIPTWFFNAIPSNKSSYLAVTTLSIYDAEEPLQIFHETLMWECLVFWGFFFFFGG